jgi:hypothetical protein
VKVNYVISFLRGSPLHAIQPLLLEPIRPPEISSYENLVEYLRINYGDPDEKGTASREWKELKQTGSASAYIAKIQQYVAILKRKEPEPIIERAIDGLKSQLKDEIARSGRTFSSLAELAAFIIPLDNRLWTREQEKKREVKDRLTKPTQSYVAPRYPAAIDTQVEVKRESSPKPQPTRTNPSQVLPRGPLSPQEKQRRRDHNLCLYCGRPGHLALSCPEARRSSQSTPTPLPVQQSETTQSQSTKGIDSSK